MGLYETETVLNEASLKEIGKYLTSPKTKKWLFLWVALAVLLAGIYFFLQMPWFSLTFAALALILTGEYFWIKQRNIKVNLKRVQEFTTQGACHYTTSFNDKGFDILNHATSSHLTIAYENLAYFAETENFYVIFSKSLQFGLVNKQTLQQEAEPLPTFLKQHHIKKIK